MYKLCITEKPDVAVEIGNEIGATHWNEGYLDGNDYLVTWAPGHLIEFAKPEDYGYLPLKDIWRDKEKTLSELPIFPAEFKTCITEDKTNQFEIIRQLMNRDDVELIIDCCDVDPESYYQQWLIRCKTNCNKPVMRFTATSLTGEDIRNAMTKLRHIGELEKIIEGEYCKQKSDWALKISLSRCLSLKYNALIDVGRLTSPTLYFVVKRYLDVLNFQPQAYYRINARLSEGFTIYLNDFQAVPGITVNDIDSNGRLINKGTADLIAVTISTNPDAAIVGIETKRRATDRPQLYDTAELQRDGNRIYNYRAADVLAAAQSLYEKKIISYPRTDSRYLPGVLQNALRERILIIKTLNKYKDAAAYILNQPTGLNIDGKIIDDSKAADCHALIVTEMIKDFDVSKLNEMEANVLHLVISRMIAALSQKYVYEETTVDVSCSDGQYILSAKENKPIRQGYKHVMGLLMGDETQTDASDKTYDGQVLPNITVGQNVHISYAVTVAKQTLPPKLHTESTLLSAMDNAGALMENGTIIKGKGIETQAARAGIIKKLFDLGYVTNKTDKNINYIEPTKLGINYLKVLPPELYSPKITADWESRIAAVADGVSTPEQFMNEYKGFIIDMIERCKNANTEKDDVSFNNGESVGACPFCDIGKVYTVKGKSEKTHNEVDIYYCSLQCGFSLYSDNEGFYNNTERKLKKSQAINLIEKNTIRAKTKYNDKYENFELVKNEKGKAYVKMIDK